VVLSTIGFLRVLFPEIFVDEIVDVAGSSKKSGVHIGDRLISVNGNSSKSSLKSLRELLDGGKVGESVKIAVSRKFNENNTSSSILLTFDVIRDYVSMVQVKRMLLSNGIGYLNIKEFSERTFVDTVEAIDLLRSEAKLKNDKLSGIIIDLRGNLGGTLSSALDIAAIFLKRGKVLMKVFNILSFFLLS
jgi:carboxyl-terminal processing protease